MKFTHIFILTGAGISAESGLDTFRDKDGLWSTYNLDGLATPDGFARNPRLVLDFYNQRRANLLVATPNDAHLALAKLEATFADQGRSTIVCTQNIDDLHERAGAKRVLHMHGELRKARCTNCGAVFSCDSDLSVNMACEKCRRSGGVRPHVVRFGEEPFHIDDIYTELVSADLFVAIGTSGAVYPAAGLVSAARRAGIFTIELNLAPSDNATLFERSIYGPAGKVVPHWVNEVIANT